MKVYVLGSGVVGVLSAYFLAHDGHDVTVIDRAQGPARETSYANGGQISASHAEPWANPAVLPKVMQWLGRKDAPLYFKPWRYDPALWRWLFHFLRNCTLNRALLNTEKTLRIALYSRSILKDLVQYVKIDYDRRSEGILHFYRDEIEFSNAVKAANLMRNLGLQREERSTEECLKIEPALNGAKEQLAGGLFSPDDESGDARKFTDQLAAICTGMGVQFRFVTQIKGLNVEAGAVKGVVTSEGIFDCENIVVALGSYSPLLLKPLGINIPVYPAKGYSVTLKVKEGGIAPRVSLTDDEYKMVYSRLGDRLRIAGTAELGGYNPSIDPFRSGLLLERALALFPEAGDAENAEFWAGLRPVCPDSVPIIGGTPVRGLYLNTGHGTLGWTMSAGSGKIIAALVGRKQPEIDTCGLGWERFR